MDTFNFVAVDHDGAELQRGYKKARLPWLGVASLFLFGWLWELGTRGTVNILVVPALILALVAFVLGKTSKSVVFDHRAQVITVSRTFPWGTFRHHYAYKTVALTRSGSGWLIEGPSDVKQAEPDRLQMSPEAELQFGLVVDRVQSLKAEAVAEQEHSRLLDEQAYGGVRWASDGETPRLARAAAKEGSPAAVPLFSSEEHD